MNLQLDFRLLNATVEIKNFCGVLVSIKTSEFSIKFAIQKHRNNLVIDTS